ncbi:trigger factor [Candidatus Peregrinibacteria bacterium]|nr:trigger factor [Candidatus Peregrinibacteria bacterium]
MEETKAELLEPKAEVKEVGPCKYAVKVEVSKEKVSQRVIAKYDEMANTVSFPGFRKGKVPRSVVERKYGKEILKDLKMEIVNQSFDEVIEKEKLDPLLLPEADLEKFEIAEDKPFVYELTLEVRPKFELPEYKKINVKKPEIKVSAKDVDNTISNLIDSKAELVPVEDGVSKENDQIVGDFELYSDDKQVLKSENSALFLNKNVSFFGIMLPEFHKALLGSKAGQTKTHDLSVPNDFKYKELAGKKAQIKIAIKGIKRKRVPELTDEFAEALGAESVEKLKEEVKKHIQTEKENSTKAAMADEIIKKILDKVDFPLPETLIKSGVEDTMSRAKLDLAMRGVDEKVAEEEVNKLRDKSQAGVTQGIKAGFVLEAVAKKERIFVTEDEIETRISQIAAGMGKWPHEVKQYFAQRNLMPQLRRDMREEKTRAFLLENAIIES